MLRVVIDTNIIISGLLFGGKPEQILNFIIENKIMAFASPEIIEEYQNTLVELISKFHKGESNFSLSVLIGKLNIIFADNLDNICRDPDDDKFISCAKTGNCNYIISGDKDLLDIGNYEGIEILTSSQFIEIMVQ